MLWQNLWEINVQEAVDEFSDNWRKIWKSAENLEKMILDKFREKDLLENCPRILIEFPEYFRFSV